MRQKSVDCMPMIFTIMTTTDDGSSAPAYRSIDFLAEILKWDESTAKMICAKAGKPVPHVNDEILFDALCAVQRQVVRDMASSGIFHQIHSFTDPRAASATHQTRVQRFVVESRIDTARVEDVEDFFLQAFLTIFEGSARLVVEHGLGSKRTATVLSAGSKDLDSPAIGGGKSIDIGILLRGDDAPSWVTFDAASTALASIIKLMPLAEQATPSARKNCAMELIELEVVLALKQMNRMGFEIVTEDRTFSNANPSIIVYCDIDPTPEVTSQSVARQLSSSERGLFQTI